MYIGSLKEDFKFEMKSSLLKSPFNWIMKSSSSPSLLSLPRCFSHLSYTSVLSCIKKSSSFPFTSFSTLSLPPFIICTCFMSYSNYFFCSWVWKGTTFSCLSHGALVSLHQAELRSTRRESALIICDMGFVSFLAWIFFNWGTVVKEKLSQARCWLGKETLTL